MKQFQGCLKLMAQYRVRKGPQSLLLSQHVHVCVSKETRLVIVGMTDSSEWEKFIGKHCNKAPYSRLRVCFPWFTVDTTKYFIYYSIIHTICTSL